MKIGILGSGDVGKALARGFMSEGHQVMIATRNPSGNKGDELRNLEGVKVGDFIETAIYADLVVLCTLWSGTEEAIKLADPANLAGKIVIDTTNPLEFTDDGPKLALGHTDSGGEQVQRWLGQSLVIKAFNTVGNTHMYKPKFSITPTMFVCGNDASAKARVTDILTGFGWETIDVGGITGARELEPLCILWVKYGTISGSWNHAFKLLHD